MLSSFVKSFYIFRYFYRYSYLNICLAFKFEWSIFFYIFYFYLAFRSIYLSSTVLLRTIWDWWVGFLLGNLGARGGSLEARAGEKLEYYSSRFSLISIGIPIPENILFNKITIYTNLNTIFNILSKILIELGFIDIHV